MKSEYFRPAKKSITEHHKAAPQPMSESYCFQDAFTDPGHPYSVPTHSAKFEALVNQVGGINQGPFKLDQRYVSRLYSSGSNLNIQTPSDNKAALSDFLHVKTVAFSNQDAVKKPKTMSTKQSRHEEKSTKPLLKTKQKLPSLYDQETTKENRDGTKRPNSVDMKLSKDNEPNNVSINQGVPKATDDKDNKDKDVKTRQSRSMSQRRSESEQGKSERRQLENSSNKSDRRYASTTPRKDSTHASSKQEASGTGRFGPLQKIKEIKMKKTTQISNLKGSNAAKSTQNSSTTATTTSTIGLSNRTKPVPSNNLSVESRTESKSFLANKTNIHNNSNNNVNALPSPQSKPVNAINSIKNTVNSDKDNNTSGLSKVINGIDSYSAAKKPAVPQQNRNGRSLNPGNQSQANGATSNLTLPPINNQTQNSNGAGLMTNGSALNLRPVYPSLRVEEAPKKKIVYVPPPQSNKYKFFVGGGNNSDLVKRVLAKRDWWEATEFFNTLFNLKWQQSYRGYRYDRLPDKLGAKQIVNHFEYHPEISTKNNLIKNLSTYCDSNKINLFDCTPLTFCFDMDDNVNFDKDMQQFAKFFITHNPDQRKYPPPSDKKNQVWYNFDYRKKGAYQHPTSQTDKVSPFLKPIMHDTFLKTANAWVLKPVGLNRGRGIEVFNTLETLNDFMNECFNPSPKKKNAKKDDGSGSGSDDDEEEQFLKELAVKSRTFVIQKYIEDPLLINKRKFDIRVWVLVTHEMQLYFFKEGYLRTSSQEFSLTGDEVSNKFIHLTNNAVQKHSTEYGQHEKGNQLSFKDFEEYMRANGLNGDFQGKILPRMKELVKISMQSVGKTLNQHDRKYCFEVFGYDFMIDNDFNVWLIEVNTNPCLDESSPLLHMLIPRMVDDAFKLTVDVIFPKVVKKPNLQQSKSTVSSDKKAPAVPQGNLNLNLKAVQKDESGDKAATVETPKPKEGETEVKEEAGEKAEEEKTGTEEKFREANAANISEMMGGNKATEDKKETLTVPVESTVKVQVSPVKVDKPEEPSNPNDVIFSVDGYSDTENMWDYICALSIPKSPMKKDLKAR